MYFIEHIKAILTNSTAGGKTGIITPSKYEMVGYVMENFPHIHKPYNMNKTQLFQVMIDEGMTDKELYSDWKKYMACGSKHLQNTFKVSRTTIADMAKHGFLDIIFYVDDYFYGKTNKVPYYDLMYLYENGKFNAAYESYYKFKKFEGKTLFDEEKEDE